MLKRSYLTFVESQKTVFFSQYFLWASVNSSPIDIESCGLQSVEEKLFLSVATMLDTKYRDALDQPLLGRCQVFCSHYQYRRRNKSKRKHSWPPRQNRLKLVVANSQNVHLHNLILGLICFGRAARTRLFRLTSAQNTFPSPRENRKHGYSQQISEFLRGGKIFFTLLY